MYGSGAGGAIYFKGTNLTVENCTFESNKNHHSKGGGAIYVDYNDKVLINIVNSTFSKNNVSSVGGALYFDNPLSLQGQFDVYITNCDFNENYAACNRNNAYGGGAIFVFRSMNVFIDSSRFVANEAVKEGGAIRYSGYLTITNSEFYSNKAKQGGALTSGQKIDLNIFNSTFANNTASEEGGAIKACFFNINDAKFINNTAPNGGAIC